MVEPQYGDGTIMEVIMQRNVVDESSGAREDVVCTREVPLELLHPRMDYGACGREEAQKAVAQIKEKGMRSGDPSFA